MSLRRLVGPFVRAGAGAVLLVACSHAGTVPCYLPDTIQGPALCISSGETSQFFQSDSGTFVAPDMMTVNGWTVSLSGQSNSPDPADPATGFGLFLFIGATCAKVEDSDSNGNVSADCAENPLHVFVSDKGFSQSLTPGMLVSILALSQDEGSTKMNAWFDASNQFFGQSVLIGTTGTIAGPFLGEVDGSAFISGTSDYSLTLESTVNASCRFDDDCQGTNFIGFGFITATEAPEPGSMALLGGSLIVLYASTWLRRRRVRSSR